jgi:hypothetical protein
MLTKHLHQTLLVLLALVLAIMACSSLTRVTATPTVPPLTDTPLPSPTPTNTAKPTLTPRPSKTPDVVATEMYDKIFSIVQKFNEEGLIPSTKGMYDILPDYEEEFAQIGWLQFMYHPGLVKHFVFNADVNWQTAIETTDISGCGIVFGVEEQGNNYEYYGVVLDKSRIYFSIARSGYYRELGKTRGTGRLDFGNPAKAELTLLVYDNHAFVYVDDNFIGEYTLSESKELRGNFGYGIISGTNKDYGTRCQIRNARMWQLTQ